MPAGDIVKEDDVLLQIETDKVTIDVRYTESEAGTLTEYLCKEDDTVAVGQEVVKVDKGKHLSCIMRVAMTSESLQLGRACKQGLLIHSALLALPGGGAH